MSAEVRDRVNRLLKAKGITQREVEQAAGVAHSTYNGMWERGTVTLERMQAIAERLGVDVVDLLRDQAPHTDAMTAEPAPNYGLGKLEVMEQRLARLELELRQLREKLRTR